MLVNGLLQTKKDGLTGLLLSRKRKLEELYYATVGCQALASPSQQQLYEQKEQAFLDSNDLTQGRYFDEATLPDRPDFASLIPPKRPTTHQVGLGSLTNKRNDARDSYLRLSPSRELQGSLKEKDAHPEDTTHGDGDLRSRSSRNQSPSTNSQADGRKQRLSDAPNTESRSERQNDGVSGISKAAQSSIGSLKGQSGDTAVEDEHTGLMEIDDGLGLDDAGPESSHAMPSIGGSSVSRPLATQPSQSPGVTIHTQEEDRKNAQRMVPTVFGEQASSPNSTVGHHSSNTPGATAVSPDTSPESDFLDEEMEAMETAQAVANKEKPSDLEDTDSHTFDRQKDGHSHTQDSGPSASDNMMVDQSPPSKLSPTSALKSQPSSIDQSTSVNKTIGTADQNASQDLQAKAAATNEASQRLPTRTTGPNQFQRPSMTIDTRVGSTSTVGDATLSQTAGSVQDGFVDSPLSIGNSATPRRAHAVSISAPSPPERMTTRVSSGAIRHKSVSEILGGPPKPSPSQTEKSGPEKASTDSSKANSATDASGAISGRETPEPGAIRLRHPDRREKERERSKLSTVVFAKPQAERMEGNEFAVRDGHQPQNEEKDYLYSLFVSQAYGPPRCPPLRGLLSSAHKTLTTANACLDLRDQQDAKIMKRIYQLQYSNRWPLRQQERSNEPPRPKSHWDYVLDEVKWMRTDFREERKWKLVAAKQCADWCAEFAACNPEQQALLRVKTKPHVSAKAQNDVPDEEMADDAAEARAVEDSDDQLQHTPELVPSAAADTPSDSPVEVLPEYEDTIAPAAIFSLSSEEVVFDIRRSPVTEKLLDELPLYEPFKIVPDTDDLSAVLSPDASWKKDIVPISRFVESKIRIQEHKPPKKRSRYEYELDDEDKSHPQSKVLALSPEQTDVALFNPENKPIRDRIHPGHAFRPPSEFPMPSQSFFECRHSSHWTYAEDDELRKLVKEYSYNWSLISSCVSPKSLFSSGAERRTPWECFERWVNLEGLPPDMAKTAYFRAYHQRLETAQRNVMAQQAAIQAQQGNNAAQPIRRRTTQPIRVDRRRSTKHLALLDGMRKLAKKRESALVKQQQAAMRKPNDAAQPKPPFSTPQEFSRLKYDRELKMVERQEQYRLQVLAHQRAAQAQRYAHNQATQQQLPNGVQGRNVAAMNANGSSPIAASSLPNGHPQGGVPQQARPHPPLQALPNGTQPNGALGGNLVGMKGMPQGAMPGGGQGPSRLPSQMSPENLRIYQEASRVQESQRRYLQQQQQQFGSQGQNPAQPGPHSSPNMGGMNMNSAMMNGGIPAGGNMGSPSLHTATMANGTSSSPRMTQPRPLSNGLVPAIQQIANNIQSQHPHLSPQQLQKMTTDRLSQLHQNMSTSQAAMNAAVGNSTATAANYGLPNDGSFQPPMPQQGAMGYANAQYAAQYAQTMRNHQSQQRGGSGGPPMANGAVPNGRQQSRSATPQTQRSGSVQAPGAGKSPRPPQAQISS